MLRVDVNFSNDIWSDKQIEAYESFRNRLLKEGIIDEILVDDYDEEMVLIKSEDEKKVNLIAAELNIPLYTYKWNYEIQVVDHIRNYPIITINRFKKMAEQAKSKSTIYVSERACHMPGYKRVLFNSKGEEINWIIEAIKNNMNIFYKTSSYGGCHKIYCNEINPWNDKTSEAQNWWRENKNK
jgi:hypothetical protein